MLRGETISLDLAKRSNMPHELDCFVHCLYTTYMSIHSVLRGHSRLDGPFNWCKLER